MGQLVLNALTDGYAYCSTGGSSWHSAVEANGVSATNMAAINLVRTTSDNVENQWTQIIRAFYAFNTSALPDTCTIDSATLVLKGYDKKDDLSDGLWEIGIYSASLIGEETVTYFDFINAGTTLLSDTIGYSSWSASGNNTFTFNSTGLAYFSKTGNTVFCLRDLAHDVADELDPNNHNPNWIASKIFQVRWVAGAEANKPVLTINYTDAPAAVGSGAYFARKIAFHGGL